MTMLMLIAETDAFKRDLPQADIQILDAGHFRDGDILPRNTCLMFWFTTHITRARAGALQSCASYSMAAALTS